MIIAIDGPAASGKGTIARQIAAQFGLPHLDTGLLYRAVARIMLDRGFDLANEAIAASIAANLDPADLVSERLRDAGTGEGASVVAAHPPVRAALLALQQQFAAQKGGAVLDGRDIGTVIAPDADAKLFIVASLQSRAQRRFLEMHEQGRNVSLDEITADLAARDERDRNRKDAPLVAAQNAIVIDTSSLRREEAIASAIAAVDAAREIHGG